jgi:hypothetical protein
MSLTHSGCLMLPGWNSTMAGFRSMTGVPETASRPTTVSSRPWTDSMAQQVTPMRFGLRGPLNKLATALGITPEVSLVFTGEQGGALRRPNFNQRVNGRPPSRPWGSRGCTSMTSGTPATRG